METSGSQLQLVLADFIPAASQYAQPLSGLDVVAQVTEMPVTGQPIAQRVSNDVFTSASTHIRRASDGSVAPQQVVQVERELSVHEASTPANAVLRATQALRDARVPQFLEGPSARSHWRRQSEGGAPMSLQRPMPSMIPTATRRTNRPMGTLVHSRIQALGATGEASARPSSSLIPRQPVRVIDSSRTLGGFAARAGAAARGTQSQVSRPIPPAYASQLQRPPVTHRIEPAMHNQFADAPGNSKPGPAKRF